MATDEVKLDPTPGKLIHALRAIGYSFPQAVADLVDNSINAKATGVAIRAVAGSRGVSRVLIADNGTGMTESEITEAMRLGADVHRAFDSLGKYGMGLKLASLSQAQRMTVISRGDSYTGGRRWTIAGIARGWQCEILKHHEVVEELDNPFDSLDLSQSGTIVVWEELDKIKPSRNGTDATISLLFNHLKLHLGLHYHRFLEDGRLKIFLERVEDGRPADMKIERVNALNPFGYEQTGYEQFPVGFTLQVADGRRLELEAHIWPSNASTQNYKLGGRAAARQGFYFYRNDRLIQAGGWNDTHGDAEPHYSLARVRVDLPREFDEDFGLNVQKSSIQVPPAFAIGLKSTKTSDGMSWSEYLKLANQIYRKGQKRDESNHPIIPDAGLNKNLRTEIQRIVANGNGRARRISFDWVRLAPDKVFELNREDRCIALNSLYRKKILQGRPATPGDAPIFKLLLFMISRETMFTERYSPQQRQQVELLNRVLLASLETMEGA